jgi:hypothetical protein
VSRKRCIVCNRPVPRITTTYWFREPREVAEAGPFGGTIEAHPEGSICGTEIFTANPPTDRAECQRYTNHQIISHRMSYKSDKTIGSFVVWDGERYHHGGWFCTGRCAMDQGLASAKFGERYTWKAKDQ